jgi:phosphomannomutase
MTDISGIFKAYDVRGKVGSELTPDVVNKIGKAFADWLPAQGKVAVGRDMRPDSGELAGALIDGLRAQGRDVIDIGEVTSDMIYFAVGSMDLAGGAVVTASHNPGAYNGIKLYRDHVIAVGLKAGLDKIRDAVLDGRFNSAAARPGGLERRSITDDWVTHCLKFCPNLKPYHIAIDNGNGMAGAILPHILPKTPLQVEAMYFEPDGTFPNHEANPMKPENMRDLIGKVTSMNLDFGVAFDGDGDRAGFVDDQGRIVSGSDLMIIMAKVYLEKYPGATVVRDVRMSHAIDELVNEWGGKVAITPVGRVYVGAKMREIGAPFGGEGSGHFYFKENDDADSGLIAALVAMQAISDSGKKLSELVDEYRRGVMIPETNFEVNDKNAAFAALCEAFKDEQQSRLDGLSVDFADGSWFNVRASNTEPVIRLNAEARTQSRLDELTAKVSQLINKA